MLRKRSIRAGGSDNDGPRGPVCLSIDRSRHSNETCQRIDRKTSAIVVCQAVGNEIRRRIIILRESGDADNGAKRRVFRDKIGNDVRINHNCRVELISIKNVDRKGRLVEGTVSTGGSHDDVSNWPVGLSIDGTSDSDNACHSINAEPPAIIVGQGVGDRVRCRVAVIRERGQADGCANGRILKNLITPTIRISHRRRIELINIVDRNRECLIGR